MNVFSYPLSRPAACFWPSPERKRDTLPWKETPKGSRIKANVSMPARTGALFWRAPHQQTSRSRPQSGIYDFCLNERTNCFLVFWWNHKNEWWTDSWCSKNSFFFFCFCFLPRDQTEASTIIDYTQISKREQSCHEWLCCVLISAVTAIDLYLWCFTH